MPALASGLTRFDSLWQQRILPKSAVADPPLKCDARAFRVFVFLIKLVLLFWIFSFPLPSWLINLVRRDSPLNNSWYAAKMSLKNRRLDGKRTTSKTRLIKGDLHLLSIGTTSFVLWRLPFKFCNKDSVNEGSSTDEGVVLAFWAHPFFVYKMYL